MQTFDQALYRLYKSDVIDIALRLRLRLEDPGQFESPDDLENRVRKERYSCHSEQ